MLANSLANQAPETTSLAETATPTALSTSYAQPQSPVTSTSATATATEAVTPDKQVSRRLSSGSKAGIAIGCLAAFLLAPAGFFLWWRRRRRLRHRESNCDPDHLQPLDRSAASPAENKELDSQPIVELGSQTYYELPSEGWEQKGSCSKIETPELYHDEKPTGHGSFQWTLHEMGADERGLGALTATGTPELPPSDGALKSPTNTYSSLASNGGSVSELSRSPGMMSAEFVLPNLSPASVNATLAGPDSPTVHEYRTPTIAESYGANTSRLHNVEDEAELASRSDGAEHSRLPHHTAAVIIRSTIEREQTQVEGGTYA